MTHRTTKGRRLGRALGWLSIGLGIPAAVSPDDTNKRIGVSPTPDANTAMRAVGVQELAVGAGILASRRPTALLWVRVLGDVLHLLVLRAALDEKRNDASRIRTAIQVVAAIGVADLIAAWRLARSAGGQVIQAETTITVNRSPDDVYRYWRNFEHLPAFMEHVEAVEPGGEGRWHWVAKAPAGTTVEWDAEIIQDLPGELIAWRSVPGADVANTGYVGFEPAPGDRGTEITVELQYRPPGGRAGAAVAKLLGEEPNQQIRDDLRRFKQVMETGEVVRSGGAPEGLTTGRQRKQRRAQPGS